MNIRHALITLCLIATFSQAFSQYPEITSWIRNESGHQADYEYYAGPPNQGTTDVQMSDSSDIKAVCYDDDHVYVRANGLASYTMGPWLMNPNLPENQDYTFKFTRNPAEETGTKTAVPLVGGVGFALNGVILYGFGDARSYSATQNANVGNGDGQWYSDAWVTEGETMDPTGGGHADDMGNYHYHATPVALYDDPSTTHSPIVGYSLDGFPVYGPFGYSSAQDSNSAITRMESGYELRNITARTLLPDGSTSNPAGPAVSNQFPLGTYIEDYEFTGNGDLDEYNGRFCITPEYPNGTYAYFLATDNAGEPAFPYIFASEYYGVISQNAAMGAGKSTMPSGLDCYTGDPIDPVDTTTGLSFYIPVTIEVFPNPSSEMAIVKTESVVDEITVYDLMGAVIQSYIPTSLTTEVQTSTYPSGLYFVKVVAGEQSRTVSLQVVR